MDVPRYDEQFSFWMPTKDGKIHRAPPSTTTIRISGDIGLTIPRVDLTEGLENDLLAQRIFSRKLSLWGYYYPLLQHPCVFSKQHSQASQTVTISHKTKDDSFNQNQASFENRVICSSSRSKSEDGISQESHRAL